MTRYDTAHIAYTHEEPLPGDTGANDRSGLEIAIIGMAGRFPGAANIDEFWKNLEKGVESLVFTTDEELSEAGLNPELLKNPNFVKTRGGVLDKKEYFDADFFGYSPNEAELMNPQMRIFHECAWEALENAGYAPGVFDGPIGLYAGASGSFHWQGLVFVTDMKNVLSAFETYQLTDRDFLSTRISYKLDLKGPSFMVQTACSTSLAAVHLACQALLNGECDMALAGGVTVRSEAGQGYLYEEGMIMSPDGHCRAFDAEAAGTVSGEGVGIVTLKPLEDALDQGDMIHAVIKGTAVNNDGFRKAGYTAPSIEGQADVIEMAHRMAGIEPESITYIETHGTGTPLGDSIEIEALRQAFNSENRHFCAIGSLKTNVGHLDNAAGIAGLIKTVLALEHRRIPPTLHFKTPNPKLDLEHSPFYVNTTLKEWQGNGNPLRAGVSAFGIGGTNVHVVLEEAPHIEEQKTGGSKYQLILLSARTPSALETMTQNLAHHFRQNPGINLADAAYTLQVGRRESRYRGALVCRDVEEAAIQLADPGSPITYHGECPGKDAPDVVFLFPGLGAQYPNMGWEIYQNEPVFRSEMNQCFEILANLVNDDIKEILYGPGGKHDSCGTRRAGELIHQIEIAQPILFIFEYALARMIMKWGIQPRAMIGYSFGEYTAACIADVLSVEDALKLLTARGQVLKKAPAGSMISVPLPKDQLIPLLPGNLSLCIDNGSACIVGGPPEAVSVFEEEMKARRNITVRLNTSHAVHSHLMDPIVPEFEKKLEGIHFKNPKIPYISNVTGEWMTPGAAVDSRYWARHLRQPVRFAEGIRTLAGQPNPVFIEIGPGRDLTTLVARYIEPNKIVNLVRPAEIDSHDIYYLLNKIGKLWKTGVSIHWPAFYGEETRRRIPLPTYPFERQRYWIADKLLTPGRKQLKKTTAPGESKNLADWFYIPTWKPSESLVSAWSAVPPSGRVKNNDRWLVFLDFTGLGDLLVKRLKEKNSDVVTVTAGTEFQLMGDNGYMINPASPEDYRRMFNALETLGFVPNRVLHMWNLTANPVDPGHAAQYLEREAFEKAQELGVYSLLHIAGAIGQQDPRRQFLVDIISSNVHDITGDEIIHPGKATLVGPLKVLPQEYANIRCRSIDVRIPGDGGENANRAREILVEQLTEELLINSEMESFETEVAFRGRHRWLRTFERFRLEEPPPEQLRLRKKGIYLITGGLGEIGLTLAELLVESVGAQLILTGRSALSTRKQWQDDKIKKLEAHGAGVWMIEADVADFERMQTIITEVEQQWGAINGVIHAAGIIAPGTFHAVKDMKPGDEDTRRHFHPKVYGTLTLEKLFREKSLDFCLLISSISTVLGGLGFTAYAAANSFMDGFVQPFKRNPSSPGPWISVNWDGMDPENTKNAFKRIFSLSPNINHLLVSRGGKLHSHIDQWVKQAGNGEQPAPGSAQVQSRPSLMNPYIPPSTPLEKSIAEIFQKMFGYNPIGIQDDFFELGLDSIKALQIRARMINIGYHVQLEDFFNFPTISALVPRIGILENNRQTVDPGPIKIPSGTMEKIQNIFPDQVQDVYPLTPMQEGMLFYSLYDNLNTDNLNTKIQAYFEQICYRVHQELDVSLIEQSVNELIKRHDILRTAFVHENLEQPMQVVLKERSAAFVYRDLRRISNGQPGEKEAYINQYIEKDKRQPFNLSKDVLIRVSVIQVDDAEYLLIWSFHHALMDGWSMGILTADYFTIYNSFLTGKPQQLQAAPDFRSYIGWLAKQDKAHALRAWKNYLWGYDEIAAIPRKRSVINKNVKMQEVYLPGGIGKILDKDYTRRLQEISVRRRVTLSAVFHALWAILLGKYSGKQDVVFGSVVSGRPSTLIGVENMVGCFINTIPVRVQFDYHTPFHHLVRTVRENALKLEPYHYFSLAEIQSQTILKQNLLDHFIEFQNYPMARQIENVGERIAQETPAMTQKLSHIQAFEQGNYDFIFDIEPGEQVKLNFGYNAHIYDNDLMIRLGTHALNVLQQILDDDEILIGNIEFLSEAEKRQILCEFNTKEDFLPGGTVFQYLERHVQVTPDRPAFVFGEFWVTYGTLNARVLQLAIMLKKQGVREESIVGILSERSPLMAVCILGVWRAGGAYIPLDREYPPERIAYILKDSAAVILLTGHEMKKMPGCQLPVMNCQWLMNASEATTFHHSSFELPLIHRSNHLAYIIYTSGSTGRPKGAMIEHDGMMNHIRDKIKDLQLNASGIVAQNASHTFDISVWQFFTSLSLGGRTVIYSGTVIRDPRRLLSQLVKDGVTILELVPSYLSMLLDMVDNPGVETEEAIHLHLNYLLVTGEEISPALVTRWFERFPLIKMVNAYGPTEASDDITHHIMDRALDVEHIPVGRPLKNVTIYIVDRFRQLCPIGVKGEIWVAGIAVGRGYLGDPERTEQAFAADPFTKGKNNRLYKTGDLGCWLPDGSIAFFGRKDYQVKIRGFRIETGEIESRLRRYEKIAQAVVTAGEDAAGHKHLIAYLVMKEPISPDVEEIKKYLQEHLPGYMIPSYFVPVQTIPLTANGKLDKKALPSLLGAGPEKIIPPRNDIEKMLVNTWAEALNIDKDMIGINTDFFHLGGHSLAMIRVMSLLSRDFEVSIDQLFKYPTIAGLAVHITYNKNRLEKEIDRVIGAIESFSARSLSGQGIVIPGADPLAADYEKYREKVNAEKPIDLSGTKHYTGILLTGATGFLGAHLLYELLNREGTHIYLPVRGSTPVEVAQRVASILSFYFGTEFYPRYKDRLTLFPSRLESENLGLDNESYHKLAAKIDVILHSAAYVNHFGLYQDFFNSNVKATENLLAFALAKKIKDFHHISTVGVCSGTIPGKDVHLFSEYAEIGEQEVHGHYLQTKLAAEKCAVASREKGVMASIYRVGNIVFHSETGKFQHNIAANAFYSEVGAMIKFGKVPVGLCKFYDFTFVDYLAKAIVSLCERRMLNNEIFHLYNDDMLSSDNLLSYLCGAGETILRVPAPEFLRYLRDNLNNPDIRDHVDKFLFYYGGTSPREETQAQKYMNSRMVCDRTKMLLAKLGFVWPKVNEEHIKKMINHCREVGFLN